MPEHPRPILLRCAMTLAVLALLAAPAAAQRLRGDEWQLDTQVLSWRGVATLLGLDANYRLHRISGRYSDIEEERQRPRSVYSLVQDRVLVNGEEFDLWQLANKYQEWLHWVDAVYGSAQETLDLAETALAAPAVFGDLEYLLLGLFE